MRKQNEVRISPQKADTEMCRRHLWYFVKQFWSIVVPNDLVWNWHMKVLCDEIQRVDELVFKREAKEHDLIINVPPGTSKTKIVSVMATAWEFARKPDLRIFVGSYSDSAVLGISDDIRVLMRSEKYQSYFPETRIRKGKDSMHLFRTTQNGEFYAFTVGGTLTSKHADILKVDDPMNPKLAASDAGLTSANHFMSATLPTRKVDKKVTPTILIMQRLHENDPTGYILKKKTKLIRHVCLPAELSERVKPESYREQYVNGLLDPLRLDREVLDEMKVDLGSSGYAGQFEQSPTVAGGNIIKSIWFKYISREGFERMRTRNSPIIFFMDTAYTDKSEDNDPSGIIATCKIGNDLYITKGAKVFLEFPELIKFVPDWTRNNGYSSESMIRIEPKASGKSVVQVLKRSSNLNVTETKTPTDDKKTRLTAASPKIEAGRVILVTDVWNEEFTDEICGFPNKSHDEYVDLIAYAVDYHLNEYQNSAQDLAGYF